MNYRPFKSLGIWAFGNLPGATPYFWIRVAHLASLLVFAVVVLIWTRSLRLGWAGTFVAAFVAIWHPALPQSWGGIDGLDALASAALVWLAAWFAWRFRDRLGLSIVLALACFFIAAGFKEFAFGAAPLVGLTVLCFSPAPARKRWLSAIVAGGVISIAIIAILIIRRLVLPGGMGRGFNYILLTPKQIAENVALLASGLLFFGNTVWVFANPSAARLAIVGASIVLSAILIAGGLAIAIRGHQRADDSSVAQGRQRRAPRVVAFLLFSFAAASFPVWIMSHVSEMYLPPIVVPLALLAGMAADGFRRSASQSLRIIASCASAAIVISCALTIRWKVNGLRDVGQRAAAQIEQILSFLPADAHDKRIAILFDSRELPPRRTYAVYRMGDEVLLVHEIVLEWPRPGKNLKLTSKTDEPLPDPQSYDLILRWDAKARRFEQISQPNDVTSPSSAPSG